MVDEIAFPRELENWLSDGPPQWAQAVAVRIALRVVPTALDPKWSHEGSSSSRSEFAKAIFRALVVSFAAAETIADGAYVDHHFESAAMTAAFSAATDEDADLQSNSRVAPTLTASQAANAVASAAVAASSETTSEAIPGAVQAFDSASEAAALAANPRGFQVGEYPLALAASVDQLWGVTSDDCRAVNAGMPITTILNSRLWTGSPPWFSEAWNQARQHLSGLGDGSDVWREWYHGRVQGLPHAFKDFDDAADETFYRWIIEQNDHWWKREPREVNADIKAKVEELRTPHPLSTEELQQNPRAFTFSLDSEGRSELDEELLPNGLHGDDDERDNHREILRLIDAALTATAGGHEYKGHRRTD